MSNLMDEITIPPQTKRGRHENEENEDRLSDLPDCVILHVLSFLNAKNAVQTCVLSTRWKHLWKRIPALILHSLGTYSGFSTLKSFDKFVSKIFTLRDASIALQALDFYRCGSNNSHFLKRIANYVYSHSSQLQRLRLSLKGDSTLILPCISSCRALTSLKLEICPKGHSFFGDTSILFPKSLNLPALTTLDLTNFAFCASENDNCAEPFSAFNNLNSLIISLCTIRDAQILRISSSTLVNLTMKTISPEVTKIELSAPSLSTFTFTGTPYQKVCGNTLSSVSQLDIDADTNSSGDSSLILFSWLLDLPNIKSLTVTASALQVLSLVPDLLKLKFSSLCNLKLLKVKLKPLSFGASHIFIAAKLMNKTRKEAAKIRKALKTGFFEPSETIPDGIVDFLLQNSREANVEVIDYCSSSCKRIQRQMSLCANIELHADVYWVVGDKKDTSSSEEMVELRRANPTTASLPPLDNES